MIISNINFNKTGGGSFANSGVQHFRYNRKTNKHLALEGFLQGQYDKVYKVDFRGLVGAGARFKLTKPKVVNDTIIEKSRVYFGSLLMYEYEKASETDRSVICKDLRSSNYLTFSFYPINNFSIISTTYYQPKVDLLKDYRLSSVINLKISFSSVEKQKETSFWNKLKFNLSLSYNYDSEPVSSVPNTHNTL